ncbi:PAS domain S-box protein [Thalassobacillus sp. C254]|uniref:PAS domain S-box protein n=1 Tax=Thalassobacillus sp. C254 TaxID=1225341 RepID=UPI0006CFF660|nr:PAS domain S-box protein [Thalassobacillus sp. C254]
MDEPHYSLVLLEDKNKAADVISPTLTECLYPRLNGRRLTKEDGLHGETVLANRPSFVYDLSENEKLRNYYHFLSSYDIRSIWCEPIVIDGNIVGIFTMYHNAPSAPTEHDIKLLNVCSCLIALAVRHTKMKEKWEQVEKQEYEMIAHYAGDAITVLNKEGCIIYASPSHLPITGYSGDELEQKNVLDYIDPDDRPEVEEKISCLHESKQEGYLEVRFRRKDGTYITVACNAKPVLKGNNKGDIYRFIVISRDITEQKIAEKKLEESEQHYKSLFYYNANPVALLDLDGKITSTNGPLEKLLSFHKEEFNGYYRQYIHPDYIESTDGYFQRAVNGEAVTYETVGLDKNGQPVYLLITNIPVILGGKTVGVYCIVNDITDKKLAQERLRESEEELRALLNSMPEFVIFQDKDGRLIELNESAKQLLSYRQTQTGSPGMLNPESFSQVEKSEWVKKDKEAWEKGEFIQYEQQMVHSDGKPRTYEIVKAPQFSDNNEKKYMVTIGRDISVRKEMEGELKETKELLEAVFNNSADAILIIKLNGELLKANPAFYSLYGYSPDDSNILQTNLIPEELREETNALLERVKKGEKVVDYETKRKTKNRELFEVSITYSLSEINTATYPAFQLFQEIFATERKQRSSCADRKNCQL